MSLLSDSQLKKRLEEDPPLAEGLDLGRDWLDSASPIQPSSLDLHCGKILVPPADLEIGSGSTEELEPLKCYRLEPGQTAVAVTKERLNLPADIAAFGFPPTTISNRAILMTNPGHIDPGYKGDLTFTLINMGRKEFWIREGDLLVTLLFSQTGPVAKDYGARRPGPRSGTEQGGEGRAVDVRRRAELRRLSRDFLNIEKRTREAAKEQARELDLQIKAANLDLTKAGVSVPLKAASFTAAASVLLTLLTFFLTYSIGFKEEVTSLGDRIARVEEDLGNRISGVEEEMDTDAKIQGLEDRLGVVERLMGEGSGTR